VKKHGLKGKLSRVKKPCLLDEIHELMDTDDGHDKERVEN